MSDEACGECLCYLLCGLCCVWCMAEEEERRRNERRPIVVINEPRPVVMGQPPTTYGYPAGYHGYASPPPVNQPQYVPAPNYQVPRQNVQYQQQAAPAMPGTAAPHHAPNDFERPPPLNPDFNEAPPSYTEAIAPTKI